MADNVVVPPTPLPPKTGTQLILEHGVGTSAIGIGGDCNFPSTDVQPDQLEVLTKVRRFVDIPSGFRCVEGVRGTVENVVGR